MAAVGLLFLLLLIVPVLVGIAMIFVSRRRGQGFPACGKCGYDVSGTLGTTVARCPECGSDFGVVGIMPPTTRSNKPAMWAGVALIVLPMTCIGASVLMSRNTYQQAQAARAAAVQQLALSIAAQQQVQQQRLQALLIAQPADPALVATFALKAAAMTTSEASERLNEIAQEWVDRSAIQTLDAETSANLLAEFQAISDRLAAAASQPSAEP